MYPYLRMVKELWRCTAHAPRLGVTDTHVSHHRCWPWDLDPWMELNNGRTLTLYDLGRIPLCGADGLERTCVKAQGLGDDGRGQHDPLPPPGAAVRPARDAHALHRLGSRFFYIEQSMWKGTDCTSHMLLRSGRYLARRNRCPRTGHGGDGAAR